MTEPHGGQGDNVTPMGEDTGTVDRKKAEPLFDQAVQDELAITRKRLRVSDGQLEAQGLQRKIHKRGRFYGRKKVS